MIEQEPKVAVIILNWNGFNDTVECLESIKETTYKNYKIVLVDNGSEKSEGLRLKEKFLDVHLISNTENRGFAGGNNDGMRWALKNKFDYIVNLNNDCLVDRNWLTYLIAGIRSAGADFGTLRIMYYPEKELICSDGDALLMDGSGIAVHHFEDVKENAGSNQIFSACGAGSIYSAQSLQDVKIKGDEFFDELYFAYYEDVDLGIRMNMATYRGVLVPDAVIYHKGTQTAGFRSDFHQFQIEKNRILNEVLNFPVWLILVGEIFYFIKSILRRICKVFCREKNRQGQSGRSGILSTLQTMIKARMWIVANISDILKDRKERVNRGFVGSRIVKYLYLNITKIMEV
jgi:GT2 family glycosyltransferase